MLGGPLAKIRPTGDATNFNKINLLTDKKDLNCFGVFLDTRKTRMLHWRVFAR